MDENLISKKDLLTLTGISYGQLYRWKRKNVIPEEWFIKKSSFTGQETYFPKDKILERISKIKDMKDDRSLDELADMFSPLPTEVSLTKEELIEKGVLSQRAIDIYEELYGKIDSFDFDTILNPYILQSVLLSGDVTFEEGKNLLKMISGYNDINKMGGYNIMLIRKFGIGVWLIANFNGEFKIDEESRIILNSSIMTFVEALKIKLERV